MNSAGSSARQITAPGDTSTKRHQHEPIDWADRQLSLLVEASRVLLSSPDSEHVLQRILTLALQFVAADAHSVWRRCEGDVWRLRSSIGLSESFIQSASITGDASATLTGPLVFADVRTEPLLRNRNESLIREGICSMMAVPLNVHGQPAGTVVFYWRMPHVFSDGEVRIASTLGNLAAAAIGTADLYDLQSNLRAQAEAAQRRASFLAESGAILASSLDYEATLRSIATFAVPTFADWASANVLDGQGQMKRVAIAHADPQKIVIAEEFAKRYPARADDVSFLALRSGRSILREKLSDELIAARAPDEEYVQWVRKMGPKSLIVVPMVVNNRPLGVITFITAESGRHYTTADLETAEELARRAAMALENARLFEESQEAQNELRRINKELREANEDLNQFAYSASHDLQEPLRMMCIYGDLLRAEYGPKLAGAGREYLDYIVGSGQRMGVLLRDILDYSKVISIAPRVHQSVDATVILQEALANLRTRIEEAGAVIHHERLPDVRVLDIHLLQIFQNLIGNAIKYRANRIPKVTIEAVPDGRGVLFSVRDNGIGIGPEYREEIFGLFKRLHTAAEYPGTGVGLAICKKIVERYGGSLWVDSIPGEGSTFFFTLPNGPDL